MSVTEDDTDRSVEELLDWLCWKMAMDGEDNYPPEKRARECCNAHKEERDVDDHFLGVEEGWHSRAYTQAVQFFEIMERRGFDPRSRAAREIQRFNEEHDGELEPIDWDWYENR